VELPSYVGNPQVGLNRLAAVVLSLSPRASRPGKGALYISIFRAKNNGHKLFLKQYVDRFFRFS